MPRRANSSTPTPKTAKRAPNFLPEEDEQLAKSWVVISEDPIKSNQQGKDKFFTRVAVDFNMFTPDPPRDANGLCCRWKNLQKAVFRFCAIYNQIEENPASGSSPSDWLTEAKVRYQDSEGKHFLYERAWSLVKNVPKWQQASTTKTKNGS